MIIKKGLSQAEVANTFGTTRENITLIEKRARKNIRLAEETLQTYRALLSIGKITVPEGTHLVDVPGILVRKGDSLGVKLKINFTRLYNEIKFKARKNVRGTTVVNPFTITLFADGDIEVVQ